MKKGVLSKKNKRTRPVLMAFVLSMLMIFLSGCVAEDFNILRFLDGNVGTPQVGQEVKIKIPEDFDFEYDISPELLDFLQSLESINIESITSIEDIRLLLQNVDTNIYVDVDMEQLLATINNLKAPEIPVEDIENIKVVKNIDVKIAIICETLADYDPILASTATTNGGMILQYTTVTTTEGSTVNDIMSQLLALSGENIPVVIDGSGNIASINGVANAKRINVNDFLEYDCFWVCWVNDVSPVGGTQGYQLQDGDEIIFFYVCELA